jgi:hypothetical protein
MKIINTHKTVANIDKKKLVIFVFQKFVELNITNEDEAQYFKNFYK